MSESKQETFEQKYQRLATEVGQQYEADVIIYSGEIEDETADKLRKL